MAKRNEAFDSGRFIYKMLQRDCIAYNRGIIAQSNSDSGFVIRADSISRISFLRIQIIEHGNGRNTEDSQDDFFHGSIFLFRC